MLAQAGFTLVEILVASAILCILAVIVAQMVGSASMVAGAGHKRLSADEEARVVFDRMAEDFTGILKRKDFDPLFLPTTGNDQFYFFSQAPAYSSVSYTNNSQISLIGYFVGTSGGLQRYGVGQGWDTISFSTPSTNSAATNYIATNSTNCTIIAPSVFRMEYALLMKQGSVNKTGTTYGTNAYQQTNNPGQALQDVAGIVVALGILDPTSRQIVTPSAFATLSSNTTSFSDAITNNTGTPLVGSSSNGIPVNTWKTNAASVTGIPAGARSQIRIYQRYFPLSQ